MILSGDDDGLAARFVLLWPEPVALRRPRATPDPGRLAEALARLRAPRARRLEGGEREPVSVRFDEAAAEALHRFRLEVREIEQGASGLFLSHVGKWPGLAARLALVLELLWWAGGERPAPGGPSLGEPAGRRWPRSGSWPSTCSRWRGGSTARPALPKPERDACDASPAG